MTHSRSLRTAAAALFLCAGAAVEPARANDSTAALEAGELRLTFNPDIALEAEELYISAKEIRVRYRFANKSRKDVTTLVAFPLPPVEVGQDTEYDVPAGDPLNFIGFRVEVDGKPVSTRLQVRAERFGVDLTGVLSRHNLPLTPFGPAGDTLHDRLEKLSPAARADLERAGLADWHTSFGAGDKPLPNPHWTAHLTFFWEQTFPAGKTVEVTHRYRPVPGVGFFNADLADDALYTQTFCMDEGFRRAAKARAAKESGGIMMARELGYVLTTANNWRGSIGEFTLTVDKGDPDHLLSLCADGVKKTGPTTFELKAQDFAPGRDLKILILEPVPPDLPR